MNTSKENVIPPPPPREYNGESIEIVMNVLNNKLSNE